MGSAPGSGFRRDATVCTHYCPRGLTHSASVELVLTCLSRGTRCVGGHHVGDRIKARPLTQARWWSFPHPCTRPASRTPLAAHCHLCAPEDTLRLCACRRHMTPGAWDTGLSSQPHSRLLRTHILHGSTCMVLHAHTHRGTPCMHTGVSGAHGHQGTDFSSDVPHVPCRHLPGPHHSRGAGWAGRWVWCGGCREEFLSGPFCSPGQR